MADIRQFTPDSLRKIQEDHTRLKALASNVQRAAQAVPYADGEVIRTVTGFTSTNTSYPTYPTASGHNTYVVKLRDYFFDEQTGVQTRTAAGSYTQSILARTWDGSTVAENTPVMCDLVHCIGKGHRWWIRPAAAAPSPNPVFAYQMSKQITAANAYIRGGSWSTTEYFGLEWEKYRGDAAANNVQFLQISAVNDPFIRILKTGHYMMDWFVGASWTYGQAREQTVASELGGAAPGHFHNVTVPNGRDLTGTMLVVLRYKLNNTGSASVINDFSFEFEVVSSESSAESANATVGFGRYQICINLTQDWYINARLQWSARSTVYHRCSETLKSSMRIQYLGETVSDTTV